jgi:hypothetical protein
MAIKQLKICDRCGKEVKHRGWTSTLFFRRVNIKQLWDGGHALRGSYDFCADCSKALELWIYDKKEEENV